MADHDVLLHVLRRFARRMTGRYELSEVLLELCEHASEILGAAGAGVALLDDQGDLRFVAATSEAVEGAEHAQEATQSGPCATAVAGARPVPVTDIRDHADRWPDYVRAVEAQRLIAVLGLPLVLDDERIGSLDVYDDRAREWTQDQVEAASVLADVAGAYLLNATALEQSRRLAGQLQHALDSRVVIEQAKGIVRAQRDVSMGEAFAAIRRHARSRNVTVRSVAEAITERGAGVLDDG